MKKLITLAIISMAFLCGCRQSMPPTSTPPIATLIIIPSDFPTSTETITPSLENTETPWPTLIYYLTMTPEPGRSPRPPKPTITAPPHRNPSIALLEGLSIDEYQITEKDIFDIENLAFSRYPNKGGWHFWPKGGMIDGKMFLAEERVRDHRFVEIHATLDKEEIFSVDCGNIPAGPTVITAWTFDEHWIIQSVCHQEFDVFWDGVSLNSSKGYQSSFAFQILGKYLFYLFKRNDQVWLSYNAQEALLGYDEVKLAYCCMSYHPPQHYENLITFYTVKNEQLYYIAIGLFEK